jgi:hypothetical protein
MKTPVQKLDFNESIAVYGRQTGTGAALLHTSAVIDNSSGLVWARVDEAGAGLEPGFYCVRARAQAELATGWWASIELYKVDGTLASNSAAKGTSSRHFVDVGEFEGAADYGTALKIQDEFEKSRAAASGPAGTGTIE